MKIEVVGDAAQLVGLGAYCWICEADLVQEMWEAWQKEKGREEFVVECDCGARYKVEARVEVDFSPWPANEKTMKMWGIVQQENDELREMGGYDD